MGQLTPLLLLPLLACKGDEEPEGYDLETWQSPLASGFEGTPDADEGERIYFEESWSDVTPYALTCSKCHSADPGDTWTTDADEYNRPAHTTWNAAYREVWKVGHSWDKEDSDKNGAYGGQICVKAYFPSGAEMTAEQAAHLEAWMKTNIDADASAETASPLDYGFNTWETQEDFVVSIQQGEEWLRGDEIGDPEHGEELTTRHCGSCHTVEGDSVPTFFSVAGLDTGQILARVRRVDVGLTEHTNERMPRVPWDRLSDDDLADVLAYLTVDE